MTWFSYWLERIKNGGILSKMNASAGSRSYTLSWSQIWKDYDFSSLNMSVGTWGKFEPALNLKIYYRGWEENLIVRLM